MTKEKALQELYRVARTRMPPEGIDIMLMDWEKGTGREIREGRISREAAKELNVFYGAIKQGAPRVEIPDEDHGDDA